MRAGRLLAGLVIAALFAIAGSWGTYRHDYVVHERAGAEWAALTLTDQTLAQTLAKRSRSTTSARSALQQPWSIIGRTNF
jgi:hypothetical protein